MALDKRDSNKIILGRTRCPKCHSKGNDSSGDNLAVYKDGHTHCFSCNYTGNTKKDKVNLETLNNGNSSKRRERVQFNEGILCMLDTVAGFTHDTLKQFDVELTVGENNGFFFQFPYYDASGNLCSYKLRKYNSALGVLERDIYMSNINRDTTVFPCFNYREFLNRKAANVLLFEGETDLLSFYQKFHKELKQVGDYVLLAISGVNTLPVVLKRLLNCNFVNQVILFLDNDSAGDKAYVDLGNDKAIYDPNRVFRSDVNFRGHKDVKALITEEKELTFTEFLETTKVASKQGVNVLKESSVEVIKRYEKVVASPLLDLREYFPVLSQSWLPRKGNLFTIIGGTGKGKSFFMEWLIGVAINQGKKVLNLSLEMSADDVIVRLAHRMTGIDCVKRPYSTLEPELKAILDTTCNRIDSHLYLGDYNGSVSLQALKDTLTSLPETVDIIVIDTFTNMAETLAWDSLEELAKELKNIAIDSTFGQPMVIVVSQVSSTPKSNTSHFQPLLTDVRGGKGLSHYSSVVLSISYSDEDGTTAIETAKKDRMIQNGYANVTAKFINGNFYEIGNGNSYAQANQGTQVHQQPQEETSNGKQVNNQAVIFPQTIEY